uniref:V-type proton ATPase subunit C n=1 Tax=Aotus nancymaae TaxID=37293 RepID=A0A2K5DVP4_AOTNA
SQYWPHSLPSLDKRRLEAFTSKSKLSYNTKFAIPDFKVGILDSLVGLSDELGKLDSCAESLIRRMAQSVVEVMEDSKGKAQEHLLANGVDLTSFVTHSEWDMAKYPAKQPLVSVVDTIAKPEVPTGNLQHSEDEPGEPGEEIHGEPLHPDTERYCEQRGLRAGF